MKQSGGKIRERETKANILLNRKESWKGSRMGQDSGIY
jgi:hypothetical protein